MVEFTKNVLPKGTSVRGYSDTKKYDEKRTGITTKWGFHTPMRTNAVKYGFHTLTDYSPKIEEMNYLKFNPEPKHKKHIPDKPYVVLQGAFTEVVKTMPAPCFNGLKEYFISMGYEVLVLGKTINYVGYKDVAAKAKIPLDYDFSGTTNLIDKTSLCESAAILSQAKLFVGIDGGLTHLAGFTDVEILTGYTFASPEQLAPIRNNSQNYKFNALTVENPPKCLYCQSRRTLVYEHDYRNCFYDDYACTKFKAEDFIKVIEEKKLL